MSSHSSESGAISLIMKIVVGLLSLVLIFAVGVFGFRLMWAMRDMHRGEALVEASDADNPNPPNTGAQIFNDPEVAASVAGGGPMPVEASPNVDGAAQIDPAFAQLGQQTYAICAACHAPDGKGMPGNLAPSLEKSEMVNGFTEPLAMIVLNGIQKTDMKFNGIMTPWKALFTDEQIAAVLTHIRANFGNEGGPIFPEQVAWAREKYAAENNSFTRAQLAEVQADLPPMSQLQGGGEQPAEAASAPASGAPAPAQEAPATPAPAQAPAAQTPAPAPTQEAPANATPAPAPAAPQAPVDPAPVQSPAPAAPQTPAPSPAQPEAAAAPAAPATPAQQ